MSENSNMRIWDAVSKTDPKHTKKVEFGRKFTSIDAHWQIQQATNQFGPIGEGWGYIVHHCVVTLTPEMILAAADVEIWWQNGNLERIPCRYGPVRGTCEMYGPKTKFGKIIPGEFVTDEDAPKKAMTDALTKGLSHLGFSADVFLGLFDDNRYVQKMEKEFAAGSMTAPGDFADEARKDGLTTETRSTHQVEKDRKAVATLEAGARMAISLCTTRAMLSDWWNENKGELNAKLPEDSFLTIKSEVITKRDSLPALEKVA